jgi:hypothetical protein
VIVLGFDPGATIGWAEVGTGPRFINGGSTRDLSLALSRIREWSGFFLSAKKDLPDPQFMVAVESVSKVYPRERFTSKMATALLLAERQAGEIVATARACGFDVLEVSAAQWRRSLLGAGRATDRVIAQRLPLIVNDMPKRTNAHVRDAVGVAAYADRWAKVNRKVVA